MDAVDRAEPIRYEIQVCAVELRNQLVQLDFEMWASTHQEEVLSEFPWWNKGLNLFHRFIEDHVDMFGPDFVEACRKIRVLLIDLNEMYWPFSSLPTGLVILREENGESPFIPGRLYLDVTDATLADVQHIWTYVDLMQRTMPGSTTKRRQGRAPGAHSSEVSRWIARAQEIGEAAALVEFKAEGDGARGDWQRRYQWWYRRVRPLLR
jgi:hypothetical protein